MSASALSHQALITKMGCRCWLFSFIFCRILSGCALRDRQPWLDGMRAPFLACHGCTNHAYTPRIDDSSSAARLTLGAGFSLSPFTFSAPFGSGSDETSNLSRLVRRRWSLSPTSCWASMSSCCASTGEPGCSALRLVADRACRLSIVVDNYPCLLTLFSGYLGTVVLFNTYLWRCASVSSFGA